MQGLEKGIADGGRRLSKADRIKANVAGATPLMSDVRRHAITMVRPLASAMSIRRNIFTMPWQALP